MRHSESRFQSRVVKISYLAVCCVLLLGGITNARSQTAKSRVVKFRAEEIQQPIYREYRGVQLNMTMEEARAKLGNATFKSDELDFYVFSANEAAQIAYNAAHKVVTISVDYTNGIGEPEPQTIGCVGLLQRSDGSKYQMIEYKAEGLWVSYNKSAGTVRVVTVTLQTLSK